MAQIREQNIRNELRIEGCSNWVLHERLAPLKGKVAVKSEL